MSDVSKCGPLGEGGESRPLKVDLTRIDIRRGTLNLPRRFYDAFPKGELEANDTVAGRKINVTFAPPRELEGLGPFFEEHDLQPNDAVTISVAEGLQLTPFRRERRHGSGASEKPAAASPDSPAGYQAPTHRTSAQQGPAKHEPAQQASAQQAPAPEAPFQQAPRREQVGGYVREQSGDSVTGYVREQPSERVRLEARQLGREQPADEEKPREQTRVRLKAQEPAAYLAPPVPETKGGWQDVLHDPAPRRGQMLRPSERAVVRPDDLPSDGSVTERRETATERTDMQQQRLFGEESERYGTVREASRPQPGSKGAAGNQPLAPKQEVSRPQTGSIDADSPTEQKGAAHQGRAGSDRPRQEPDAHAPRQDRFARQEPEPAEEREPVLVAASSAQGDVNGRISRYLQEPNTPAIVRAAAVAEDLRLPLDAVQQGLAEVSRNSEGAVAPIRPGVYLVKRSR